MSQPTPPLEPDDVRGPCGAHTPTGRCPRPAGAGTPHEGRGTCSLHGGWLPTHRAKAFAEDVEDLIRRSRLPVQTDAPEKGLEPLGAGIDLSALLDALRRHARTPGDTQRSTPWTTPGPPSPHALTQDGPTP